MAQKRQYKTRKKYQEKKALTAKAKEIRGIPDLNFDKMTLRQIRNFVSRNPWIASLLSEKTNKRLVGISLSELRRLLAEIRESDRVSKQTKKNG